MELNLQLNEVKISTAAKCLVLWSLVLKNMGHSLQLCGTNSSKSVREAWCMEGGVVEVTTNLHLISPQHFRRNSRSIYIISNTMNKYTMNDSYFLSSIPYGRLSTRAGNQTSSNAAASLSRLSVPTVVTVVNFCCRGKNSWGKSHQSNKCYIIWKIICSHNNILAMEYVQKMTL